MQKWGGGISYFSPPPTLAAAKVDLGTAKVEPWHCQGWTLALPRLDLGTAKVGPWHAKVNLGTTKVDLGTAKVRPWHCQGWTLALPRLLHKVLSAYLCTRPLISSRASRARGMQPTGAPHARRREGQAHPTAVLRQNSAPPSRTQA